MTTNNTGENLKKFKALLAELFQFDSADLDFGIYAVLNRRRAQIEAFINRQLETAVEQGLTLLAEDKAREAKKALEEARQKLIENFGTSALDSQGNIVDDYKKPPYSTAPAIKTYEAAQANMEALTVQKDTKARVFNDLLTFFDRYYEDGDFVTKRRFGRDKYAVPYNGEEVYFHWANANQYYIKSGEHFNRYSFTLPAVLGEERAKVVLFKLAAAEIDRDNTKSTEKRFFVLSPENPFRWDDTGRTLALNFEYRALTADEKTRVGTRNQQDKLNEEAIATLTETLPDIALKAQLLDAPDDNTPPPLIKHLNRFTARNTRDFFIHRDLRGFLRRELDYTIKNEVLSLIDLDPDRPILARAALKRAKTVEAIARDIIDFLAQIEDFQKYLFEKRKFVTQSDYCLTLDKIPPAVYDELLPEILANEAQLAAWRDLYAFDTETAPDLFNPDGALVMDETFADLHPRLMIDTAYFDDTFKAKLLAAFDDLEGACDGLLVHSENFQALNLLLPRYEGSVKCCYIDPPYNTGNDGFIYRDNVQHSSWLSMMENRLQPARDILAEDGIFFVSINDNEGIRLREILDYIFSSELFLSQLIWKSRQIVDSRPQSGISIDHEYVLVYGASKQTKVRGKTIDLKKYSNPDGDPRGAWMSNSILGLATEEQRPNLHYDIIDPETGIKYKCPPHTGWRYSRETMKQKIEDKRIVFPKEPSGRPREKKFLKELTNRYTGFSSILSSEVGFTLHGTRELRNIFGEQLISFPKPVSLLTALLEQKIGLTLDFFAGSGTTGHAVMNLNREDGGKRKYILVEMGDHFDTVLRPRLMKVAYAADWKNGKPVPDSEGQAQMFHYIRLESYEDALNNVHFTDRNDESNAPMFELLDAMDGYDRRHLLFYESRDNSPTLVDTGGFSTPFDYALTFKTGDAPGETEERPVDLVTTFNFLLGLQVQTRREYQNEWGRVVCVTGLDRAGNTVVVLWRTVPQSVDDLLPEANWLAENVPELTAHWDTLYTNGLGQEALSHTLRHLGRRIDLIEPAFKRLMLPRHTWQNPGSIDEGAI